MRCRGKDGRWEWDGPSEAGRSPPLSSARFFLVAVKPPLGCRRSGLSPLFLCVPDGGVLDRGRRKERETDEKDAGRPVWCFPYHPAPASAPAPGPLAMSSPQWPYRTASLRCVQVLRTLLPPLPSFAGSSGGLMSLPWV